MQLIHIPKSDVIFLPQYEKHVQDGCWKARKDEEIEELIRNHHLLIENGEILAGCSISPFHEISIGQEKINGRIIECLWRKNPGQEHGLTTIQQAIEIFPHTALFAFSKKDAFERAGFQLINGITSSTGAQLWKHMPHL